MKVFTIDISDEAAEVLTLRAKANRRPFRGEAAIIIERELLPNRFNGIDVVVARPGEENQVQL